jgi:hypothetical protein
VSWQRKISAESLAPTCEADCAARFFRRAARRHERGTKAFMQATKQILLRLRGILGVLFLQLLGLR